MRLISLILFIFLLGISSISSAFLSESLLDKSHEIFFPQNLESRVGDYEGFPMFWWDFLVGEVNSEKDWKDAESLCQGLRNQSPHLISSIGCQYTLSDFAPLVRDWSRDFFLRSPRPKDEYFQGTLDSALSQASLPTGDRALLEILRVDPFETWRDLKSKVEAKIKINLPTRRGFFFDTQTNRIVIPIQMAFSPSDTSKTLAFRAQVESLSYKKDSWGGWSFIGPHGSNLQNEGQIIDDMHRVSMAGLLLLVVFGLILLFLYRGRVLILVPPVLFPMVLSAILTIFIFGSIHGLTLAFGTAIVGLAMDYGLQAAFNGRSPHLWRSNFFGVITTIVGLVLLMFSSIPLLRQMMVFSTMGLIIAFGSFYFLFRSWPELFIVPPLKIKPKPNPLKTFVAIILILFSFISVFVMKPTLDLSHFDFQDSKTRSVSRWLFQTLDLRPPFFAVSNSEGILERAHEERRWAENNGVRFENLASYIPPFETQRKNITTWANPQCRAFEGQLSESKKRFFKPFFEFKPCDPAPINFSSGDTIDRTYLEHLRKGSRWLSVWMPESDRQEKALRQSFPKVISLKEVAMEVPLTLGRELGWMGPLSILLVTFLLLFYYRNGFRTVLALVPFFSGMGLISFCTLAFKLEVSFVTIIALVMVFGFSIDYGIFATDLHRGLRGQSDEGVWTGLTFAILTTCAGFIPLLLCKHPVLRGLGQTLFLGSLGTYVGAVWGIPGLSLLYKEWRSPR